MSTRSAIIIQNTDGTAEGIYCHFDGNLSHHKPILLTHYDKEETVRELIALGDISILGKRIGAKHSFSDMTEDQVTAYGRDRGEYGTRAKTGLSWRKVSNLIGHNGYIYVFDVATETWLFSTEEVDELVPLVEAEKGNGE